MDCFGSIKSGYSSEDCQALLVNTNIVYSIEKERYPGLGEDDCEPSLMICPQYLAAQRLTQGTQCVTAHLGPEDPSIGQAHRELYSLLDGLDSLSNDLPAESDQFVEALLEMRSAVEDKLVVDRSCCPGDDEFTTGSEDYEDVFQFGATDIAPSTILFPEQSRCVLKPKRKSTTLETSCFGVTSKPYQKRRFSSLSQGLRDVTYNCVKRRRLSSHNIGNAYNETDHWDFTVSSSPLSSLGEILHSHSSHSLLRAT